MVTPRAVLALPLVVGLLACPYAAKEPLSTDRSETDERLLGKWRCVSGEGDQPGKVTISRGAELHDVLIEAPGEEPDRLVTFITTVGTERILNVAAGRTPRRWHFVRYTFTGEKLAFAIAEEKAFEGKRTPREVIASGEPGVFQPALECARIP